LRIWVNVCPEERMSEHRRDGRERPAVDAVPAERASIRIVNDAI
jgi:hypothetical protein